jgi:glutamate synthase (NADPH/NADH) small chain
MINFVNESRRESQKRDALERIKDYKEIYYLFDDKSAVDQSGRCIQCGDPYCHNKCPLHNVIPYWLKQTKVGNLDLAFKLANETSPFPEILGRICPQDRLCEGDCTLNDGHGAITIGSIETYISEKGFENNLKPISSKAEKVNKKVAIIGSGPAGISAATFLIRRGFDVVVYERAARAGGLLTYGIPNFKLDKDIVQRRVDWLIEAGVEFKLNCEIGVDISINQLQDDFDAIFIGIGATASKSVSIPNSDVAGVHMAIDFLTVIQKRNFNEPVEEFIDVNDKRVVVIGGGDTAMDCVRTSVREGAKSVKCLYRRDEANMPGSKKEYTNANDEGVEFIFNASPKSVMTCENGSVKAIVMQKTQLGQKDSSGRARMEIVEDSDFIVEADIIIFALGFDPAVPSFLEEANIKTNSWGGIELNDSYQTSNPKIFAGGDCYRGADLAVNAAKDAKEAATKIASYLGV